MLHGSGRDERFVTAAVEVTGAGRSTDENPSAPTNGKSSLQSDGHAILIVDDDLGTRETVAWTLGGIGFRVRTARSGREGIAVATAYRFDLMFIDLRLPDMDGIEMIRELERRGRRVAFVVVSGHVAAELALEARRLGALEIIEKPFAIHELSAIVLAMAGRQRASQRLQSVDADAREPSAKSTPRPRSAAERWARYVLKGCESDGDLKTLADWAKCVGVSYSSMRESCRLLDIQPRDARDLVRMLRVVIKSRLDHCPTHVLLDISDSRTLRTLMIRAGMDIRSQANVTVENFLQSQRFIASENEGLWILHKLLCES